jgi:hypothetical protein
MINEKLAQHLSNHLWISKDRIVEVFESYEEEIQPTKKNLDIETKPLTAKDLVIGGKYVPISKSVGISFNESKLIRSWKESKQPYIYYQGMDAMENYCFSISNNNSVIGGSQIFLPSDVIPYIEEPKERDWTGVRFKMKSGNKYLIERSASNYAVNAMLIYFTQKEVDNLFADGTWIELPPEQETPIIHVQKPNILEERIKRIEQHLKL